MNYLTSLPTLQSSPSLGIFIDLDKILAIRDWSLPTTLRSLCGFLGLTGYYLHFVCHYTKLAAPLSNLLQKNSFVWTPTTFEAFNNLKEALMRTHLLQLPNFKLPFIV